MRAIKVISLLFGLVWTLECHSSQCSAKGRYEAALGDPTIQPTITLSSGPSLGSAFPLQVKINLQIGHLSGSGAISLTKVEPTSLSLVWEGPSPWLPSASTSAQDWSAAYTTPALHVFGAGTTSPAKSILGTGNLTPSSSSFPTPTALESVTNGTGDRRVWTAASLLLWQIVISGLLW